MQDVTVHALCTIGLSLVSQRQAERGLAMLAQSQEMAEALGLPHDVCSAYTGWSESLVRLERYGEAQALYERLLAYSRVVGAEVFEGVALALLGGLDWWSRRWKAALGRRQAIEQWISLSAAPFVSQIWATTFLGQVYNDRELPH